MNTARSIPPQRMLPFLSIRRELQEHQRHVLLLAVLIRGQRYKRQRRLWWVQPRIDRRMLYGQYHTLMTELERECQGDFIYIGMPAETRNIVQHSNDVMCNILTVVRAVLRSHVSFYKNSIGRATLYVRGG